MRYICETVQNKYMEKIMMKIDDVMKLSKQERTAYFKKYYPFSYYSGFITGFVSAWLKSIFRFVKKIFLWQ